MNEGLISEDGRWQWDGQRWNPRQQQTPPTPTQTPQKPSHRGRNTLIALGAAVALIVLIVVISVASSGGSKTPTASTHKPAATAPATAAPTAAPTAPPTAKPTAAPTPDTSLTVTKFNAIQNGMSYEQVKQIMGSAGTLQVDSSVAGYTGQIYEWKETGFLTAKVVTVQFQNGAVIQKAQFGLD
jgi:hypothetical protein